MSSVEKRRSGRSGRSRRKSGKHRKYSDGGFSDTSSGGSFLDETDREVRSLTDKAFRSLCIGDEAVYNDSDLGPSSPGSQKDRQLAFGQSGLEREDREDLKRTAHDSFSMMVQQYGQNWNPEGMYGAEKNINPTWEVYGDMTQGRLSATFQNSFMEMSQQERFLREDHLGHFSNGLSDLSLQNRRSRSRVSSLIRAFNSEDGAVMEGQLRDWNETSWNRPALMSMPTTYQQNFTNGQFQFSSQDVNLYTSGAAAVSHMDTASSFMASSHSQHSTMTQVDCNTNVFIHSEYSPFRVWREHNRLRFQQGEVSGLMHCSEFPKWNHTTMYKQTNGSSMFQERSIRNHRTMITPVVPNHPSISTRLQKASAIEKRCESDLAVHHPLIMRTHSLGTKRLTSQRPSTASPTTDVSSSAQDTVKALQEQIKMMTGTETAAEKQGVLCKDFTPLDYDDVTMEQNVPGRNNLLSPQLPVAQAEPPEPCQYAGHPEIVEHAPVRVDSSGATPNVRMSSYKSKATSLLFNLKDNRKRVKSTYSPSKYKSFETVEKSKDTPLQQPKDTVIDIPEDLPSDGYESSWNPHQYVKPSNSPKLLSGVTISHPTTGHISDYKTVKRQDEQVKNYTSNQLINGQNLTKEQPSSTSYTENTDLLKQPGREYLTSKDSNEADVRQSAQVSGYYPTDSINDNSVSKETLRSIRTPNTEKYTLPATVAPWKEDQHVQANIQEIHIKEEIRSPKQQNMNKNIDRQQLYASQVTIDTVCAAMLKDNQQPLKSIMQGSSKVHQVKDGQFTDVKAEQTRANLIQSEQMPVSLPKVERWNHVDTPKDNTAESAQPVKTDVTIKIRKETDRTIKESPKAEPSQFTNRKEKTIIVREQVEHIRETKAKQTNTQELKGTDVENQQLIIETTQSSQKDCMKPNQDEVKPVRIEQEGDKKMVQQVREETFITEMSAGKQIKTDIPKVMAKPDLASTKIDKQNVEDVQEKKAKAEQVQPKAEIHETKETNSEAKKAEQVKLDLINMDLAKVAIAKQQQMTERLTKPTILANPQHVKSEPSKVERVKAELAKAKAELAKIKENMKGQQIEKVTSTMITMEEGISTKELTIKQSKEQPQATQTNQPSDKIYITNKVDHEADYYETLREKYGFTNKVYFGRNKTASNNTNVISALPLDNVKKVDDSKSKNEHPPISGETKQQVKEDVKSKKKGPESHNDYSASTKEFKLLPTCREKRAPGGVDLDKGTDVKVDKLERYDALSHTQQTHSGGKHKSECGTLSNKGLKITSMKASSHEEKAQTKQEILTSKIKAHAEKEISAIMEVFKQIPASPNLHEKLRPPLHEMSRGNGSTEPSNGTSKHHMGTLGVQLVKELPSSRGTSGQNLDHLEKDVPIEPGKDIDPILEPPTVTNNAPNSLSIDGSLLKNQTQSSQPETQNKEQELTQEILQENLAEKLGKPKNVIPNPALNSDQLMEESSQSTSTQSIVHNNFVFGQTETFVAKDNLQILGKTVNGKKNAEQCNADSDKSCVEMCMTNEFVLDGNREIAGETHSIETQLKVSMNMHHDVTKNMLSPLQQSSNISAASQSKVQVEEALTGKDASPAITLSSINKVQTETQLLYYKQDMTTAEKAECTLQTFKEDSVINCIKHQEEIHTGEIKLQHTAPKVISSGINYVQDSDEVVAETQSVTPSLEEDVAPAIKLSKCSNIGDKSAPLSEEKSNYMANPLADKLNRHESPKPEETNLGEINQQEDVHIDSIEIKVVPGVPEIDNVAKHLNTTCSNVATTDQNQPDTSTNLDKSMSILIKDDEAKYPVTKGWEEQVEDKLKDNLSVQHVLSSVRKLADSLKNKDQQQSINKATDHGEVDLAQRNETTANVLPNEGNYFQVQCMPEKNPAFKHMSTNVGDMSTVSKAMEHSDQLSSQTKSESSTLTVQTRGVTVKSPSRQNDWPSELQNRENIKDRNGAKHHSEVRSSLSEKEKQSSRNPQPAREEPQVKSKPKDRVSTIPDISALADYARLKVIVSEDRENTHQEFPPHKKEGFFPLIKSRHSRRPVFTSDIQDHYVKENILPKKAELNAKVNKEPKPVVFPITEIEHQRTGMFKLEDRDRLEKNVLHVKDHKRALEKHLQDLKKMTQEAQVQKEVEGKEVFESSRQRNIHFTQTTPSSSFNKPRETNWSVKQLDDANLKEDSKSNVRRFEKNANTNKLDETISDKLQKVKLEAYPEKAKVKLQQVSRGREDKTTEDMSVIIGERGAFISEEQRCAQREAEEWEKLKETAQRMEEERRAKQTEGRRENTTENKSTIERKGNIAETQEYERESMVVGDQNRLSLEDRTAQEEEQMRALLKEEQRLAKKIEERRRAERRRIKNIQEQEMETQQKGERKGRDEPVLCADKQGAIEQQREEQLPRGEGATEKVSRNDETKAKKKEHSTAHGERVSKSEEQKRAALLIDALQYYTITSTDKKPKERRARSPVPLQKRNHPPVPSEDSGLQRTSHRPPVAASPAPSLPRSNASSPALGAKPLMFRVKDNTTKGSPFIKSVKPRFHKNFGEDSRGASPMEWRADRREDEQEIMRRNTGTPINADTSTGLNRLVSKNESSNNLTVSSSQEYSAPLPHHKPFSRRNIAPEEEDFRSVISNISEDVESFATSATDLADVRGFYDYERPVSACSLSSDMSRLGKPPTVPPKSDKALRKAQRLTTRRIRKEISQDTPAIPEEKPQQRTSSRASSASSELQ
ncbi:uncharacterized protein LOC133558996 isoform X2 [Nerophis ophidion]|uniref:uncharacterized protein LOC133558996 isoform X2 n=1 Tax=Nerophis ophidion TaxID=159077 RepID=UPI002ADFC032|nr:uncharacterized protein LOC133558996 isoform X2 [Nerophis ophidion]